MCIDTFLYLRIVNVSQFLNGLGCPVVFGATPLQSPGNLASVAPVGYIVPMVTMAPAVAVPQTQFSRPTVQFPRCLHWFPLGTQISQVSMDVSFQT